MEIKMNETETLGTVICTEDGPSTEKIAFVIKKSNNQNIYLLYRNEYRFFLKILALLSYFHTKLFFPDL